MIICAALKVTTKEEEDIIIPCIRHSDGFAILAKLGFDRSRSAHIEQGFVDNRNKFYSRKEAYNHTEEIGQLPMSVIWNKNNRVEDELFSEDLY